MFMPNSQQTMSMSNEMSNLVKFILKYTARPKEEKKPLFGF